MLEKRMRKRSPPFTPQNIEDQSRFFEILTSRVLADVDQMNFIGNFFQVELTKKEKNRERFPTLRIVNKAKRPSKRIYKWGIANRIYHWQNITMAEEFLDFVQVKNCFCFKKTPNYFEVQRQRAFLFKIITVCWFFCLFFKI